MQYLLHATLIYVDRRTKKDISITENVKYQVHVVSYWSLEACTDMESIESLYLFANTSDQLDRYALRHALRYARNHGCDTVH